MSEQDGRRRPARLWLGLAAVVWLGSAGFGLTWLTRYKNTPGAAAAAPRDWPADSALALDRQRHTLVLFVHPHCYCTRATLEELALLLDECPGRARSYLVFSKPPDTPDGWEQSDLWHRAAKLPGVHRVCDADDAERQWFGAITSGQVLLYDARGRLRYRGGITRARGHTGDNPGRTALTALLNGSAGRGTTPVFGCPLEADPAGSQREAASCTSQP